MQDDVSRCGNLDEFREGRKMSVENKATWLIIASLLALCTMLAGCGSVDEIIVRDEDAGGQVDLQVGQILTVSLESNPTTGYSWQVADLNDAVLQQLGEVEFKQAGEEGLVGAGGIETFRFESVCAGETSLELKYVRPWEEGVPPEKIFTIQVVIQ
jgi:inhibitor of cysteine peptidase